MSSPPQARFFFGGFEGIYTRENARILLAAGAKIFSDFLKIWPASQKVVFNPPSVSDLGGARGGLNSMISPDQSFPPLKILVDRVRVSDSGKHSRK